MAIVLIERPNENKFPIALIPGRPQRKSINGRNSKQTPYYIITRPSTTSTLEGYCNHRIYIEKSTGRLIEPRRTREENVSIRNYHYILISSSCPSIKQSLIRDEYCLSVWKAAAAATCACLLVSCPRYHNPPHPPSTVWTPIQSGTVNNRDWTGDREEIVCGWCPIRRSLQFERWLAESQVYGNCISLTYGLGSALARHVILWICIVCTAQQMHFPIPRLFTLITDSLGAQKLPWFCCAQQRAAAASASADPWPWSVSSVQGLN